MRWLAYPVAYLAYALTRGSVDGWYPYFFIDVAAIGYGRALTNAALLSGGMLVAGYAVVALVVLARWARRRP
ncbi:MAG: Pr6Pr family membrane protein [Vicinamibacterales bacterium]